jgi:hypothetical protein
VVEAASAEGDAVRNSREAISDAISLLESLSSTFESVSKSNGLT